MWTSGERPRACIAEPLRTDGTDVAGLLAVVATSARVFAPGERADLKAIASRMSRELSWQASQARLVSDAEQAGAGLHDPLTACLTRSAFEQAVAASKNLPERPDNMTLLKLYALYKQATTGDVDGKRPGFTDMVGRAKWDAWNELKGTDRDGAMKQYVALVDDLKG